MRNKNTWSRRCWCLLLTSLWLPSPWAQTDIPPFGPAYVQSEVATVAITMESESVESMLFGDPEYASTNPYPATVQFQSSLDDTTFSLVAVRLRGSTGLTAPKKNFKVDLNAFMPDQKYADLEKLNLNANQNDPSLLRAGLSWNILRRMGLSGSRTSHVRVEINGDYMGAYLNTEHLDEEFVEEYYDQDNGNLYKCRFPADLDYISANPDDYKLEVDGQRIYELKTNVEADDYSDIAEFIDVLSNTPETDFKCAIEGVFNVADYLKVQALDVVSGNWAGYAGSANNFYLYHNPQTGLFDYIPYDLDNTWGIDFLDGNWEARDPYAWSPEFRLLYERLMAVPEYREWYTYYLQRMVDDWAHPDSVSAYLSPRHAMLMPAIEADAYYPLSHGFTTVDFEGSLETAAGGHVEFGIMPWLETRTASLEPQLDEDVPVLVLHEIEVKAPALNFLRVRAIVDGGGDDVEVSCWVDAGAGSTAYAMFDDGEHGDRKAGDGTWGVNVPIQADWTTATYQVQATSTAGLERWIPCSPELVTVGMSPSDLVINELISSNANNVSDEFGEFDDWVELFNAGNSPVSLGGKYLTDNLNNPDKYALPGGVLGAGEWSFYWMDNDPEQGPHHAPFTLSAGGEQVALLEWNEADQLWVILDFIPFGPSEQDASLGRYPDGADYWVWFATPTPSATNNYAIILGQDELGVSATRQFAPNPTVDWIRWTGDRAGGRLFDAQGRELFRFPAGRGISLGGQPAGVDVLQLDDGSRTRIVKHN